MSLAQVKKALRSHADPKRAGALQRFFKTAPGEYAHGDVFIGLTVPEIRRTAKMFKDLDFSGLEPLLRSKIHEERLLALIILVERYRKAEPALREPIYRFYSRNIRFVNNWDLVDSSAPTIVGGHFLERDRKPLYVLARSKNIWLRRISVLATFEFIRWKDFGDSLRIAEVLLRDEHDLIHKACGWMLREVGKRDPAVLEGFLSKHAAVMPRTMLRYSIEKLSPAQRKRWMGMRGRGLARRADVS